MLGLSKAYRCVGAVQLECMDINHASQNNYITITIKVFQVCGNPYFDTFTTTLYQIGNPIQPNLAILHQPIHHLYQRKTHFYFDFKLGNFFLKTTEKIPNFCNLKMYLILFTTKEKKIFVVI